MTLGTIIRLSLANSIGFLVSTLVALWLGGVSSHFGVPPWFAGLAAFAQIGGAALFNTLTPQIFGRFAPLPLSKAAFRVAAAGYVVAALAPDAIIFVIGCLVSGCATGIVLNMVNRLMGSSEHVQRSYAILVLVQIGFGTVSYLAGAAMVGRFGMQACFAYSAAAALLGSFLLDGGGMALQAPAVTASPAPERRATAGTLALAAIALFYIGLAPLSAFMPSIGQAAGLTIEHANQIIGLGLPFSVAGAVLAKLLGERVKPLAAVVGCAVLLALSGPVLTIQPNFTLFIAGVFITVAPAMFSTPYFFSQLGALDRSGRYAAKGPAMMMAGLAIGPSIAVILDGRYGLAAIGILSCTMLLLSAIAFAASVMLAPPTGKATLPD